MRRGDGSGALAAERRVLERVGDGNFVPGEFVRVGPDRGGGGAGAELLCKIASKAGMGPPYLYTAVQVQHDGGSTFGSDDFVALPGGIAMSGNLINLAEVGASGLGVLYLPVGAVVPFRGMGMRFCTNTSYYRGTF
jgi:hypothetical protein